MISILLMEEAFKAKKLELAKRGVVISTPTNESLSGTAEYFGVKVNFHFELRTQTLKMTILAKPFLTPASVVETAIRGWFSEGDEKP